MQNVKAKALFHREAVERRERQNHEPHCDDAEECNAGHDVEYRIIDRTGTNFMEAHFLDQKIEKATKINQPLRREIDRGLVSLDAIYRFQRIVQEA